jgi:exopolyphosphatase / guanosine-5'-triphosphate,3'-diphosphate pyrophosphatase
MPRYAVIDVGTNTVRLLVADGTDGRVEFVHSAKQMVRLGRELARDGSIGPRKVAEVAEVVAAFAEEATLHGAGELRVLATSAAREAQNGAELAEAVQIAAGVPREIVDGDEEARLAFTGALSALADPLDGEVGVVDVGGGSTEIVVGSASGGISWARSFRLGSGRIADTFFDHDPPSPGEMARARRLIDETLPEAIPRPSHAVAVAGSATNLRRMVGPLLDEESLERALRIMGERPAHLVARQFSLDAERARILPGGALILHATALRLGQPLWVCRGGIREGAVLDMLSARSTG